MMDSKDFIDLEIIPTLGAFEEDYDVEGICAEVMDFDPVKGCVWKAEYEADEYGTPDAYWKVVQRFDKTVVNDRGDE